MKPAGSDVRIGNISLWTGAKEELRVDPGHDCIAIQGSSTSHIQNNLIIHVTFARWGLWSL